MALGNDGVKPDALELRIRFLCGAVMGAVIGAGAAIQLSGLSIGIAIGAGSVMCGLLARQLGDRFWSRLRWWV